MWGGISHTALIHPNKPSLKLKLIGRALTAIHLAGAVRGGNNCYAQQSIDDGMHDHANQELAADQGREVFFSARSGNHGLVLKSLRAVSATSRYIARETA